MTVNTSIDSNALNFTRAAIAEAQQQGAKRLLYPIAISRYSDQLTPVLAYRRLVEADERLAPSFLLESVERGMQGRYSYLASRPAISLVAYGENVTVKTSAHLGPAETKKFTSANPLKELDRLMADSKAVRVDTDQATTLPAFSGGWVGYAGYDTVRYLEGEMLDNPPADDRQLPDMHMGMYLDLIAFDHVQKLMLLLTHVVLEIDGDELSDEAIETALAAAYQRLEVLLKRVETPRNKTPELTSGAPDTGLPVPELPESNMGEGGYQKAVEACKEYIAAGDAFQIVPSQRFEVQTAADPFDIYRSLRVVNPSPYMFYLQAEGTILVGSSPEILCRVEDGTVVTRPLAGTRKRGRSQREDAMLEKELLSDPKEVAEHVMLVDLGRNDLGRVAEKASIELTRILEVERYSHVMHISSTVEGKLDEGLSSLDALRMVLPVGTVSGAPKIRAMQIIDELEPTRRGPYAGAVGYVDLYGDLDMAIALRTLVVTANENNPEKPWRVFLQAGAGVVADSDPQMEHEETVNKAAALAKAIRVAEAAFTP